MLRTVWLVNLLVISAINLMGMEHSMNKLSDEKLKPHDCPKYCAIGCVLGCRTLSWVSWGCGICCWLPRFGKEMPSITARVMDISKATNNAADYYSQEK